MCYNGGRKYPAFLRECVFSEHTYDIVHAKEIHYGTKTERKLIMKTNRYTAEGVSLRALNTYFEKAKAERQEIHTLQIWKGERCLCRLAPAPYSCDDRREVYSLSKTFCSTAVGCAVDEGLLTVDDRIVDIFADKLPEVVSENLAKMKVRHVLSMNTGHSACVMPHMFASDDAAKAFLAQEVPYEPGTHFAYNTGATCLLSAIITRLTGETVYDYLCRKILHPIGIRDAVWNTCAEGINEGGIGIQVTSDDIIQLARLYQNRGMWNGKRLLSEEWIKEASSFHSDNSMNGTPDWKCGYGYQIWLNVEDGYRGDGALGQLMVILPKRDIIIAVQAKVPSIQIELDLLMELAAHILDEDDETELRLLDFAPAVPDEIACPVDDAWYTLSENLMGWKKLHLTREKDVLTLDFSNGRKVSRITAGAGHYEYSAHSDPWRTPKLLTLMDARYPETLRMASYYTVSGDTCTITARHLSNPNTERITLKWDGDTLDITLGVPDRVAEKAKSIHCTRIS